MEFDYWENAAGESYVKDFILEQDKPIQGKLITKIADLSAYPLDLLLRTKKVIKLSGANIELYEIRMRCNKAFYRFLFVVRDDVGYLLEAFKKKSNDTPQRYIDTAVLRSGTLDYQLSLKSNSIGR